LDVKKRFTEEQIIGFASYYLWRTKYGGMSAPEAKGLRAQTPPAPG
jgi:hypothetical protein